VARLGSGGMGTVYLSHMPDGEPTALKVIRPELAEAPDFQRQFEREIRAARQVRGQFTVPVLQSEAEGPVPWLATSYVAGPSLGEAVGAHGPLPEETALRLVAGVAEALRDIHAAGVVHRDLKPSNVLLAADGPRVIDFGIARAADATATQTEGARRVGTPGFMAPEQVRADGAGAGVTDRADMFALGLLACFAATGRGAFGQGQPDALLYRIVHDEPDLSELPDTLRDIVVACLAKDPARRPGPDQLLALALAGVVGFGGNAVAAVIRTRAGRRLDSPALVADGDHARVDALVSLGVTLSAVVVALGLEVADPVIALAITAVILRIPRHSWRTIRHGIHEH
jgi:serine/threonine protein kinase